MESRIAAVLKELSAPVPEPLQAQIVRRVGAFIESEIARERERCVELCLKRAELWERLWERTTAASSQAPAIAREEARARANEAKYLADLIEREQELFDSLPVPVSN